jgi:hypothetical protein
MSETNVETNIETNASVITEAIPEKRYTPEEIRNIIFQSNDLPVTPVMIPEWGGITLYIRPMTAKDKDEWQARQLFLNADVKEKGGKVVIQNLSASLLVKMLCHDPEGKHFIFSDAEIDAMGEKSAVVINRLQEAIRTASGVTKADQEQIEKNLSGQNGVSG